MLSDIVLIVIAVLLAALVAVLIIGVRRLRKVTRPWDSWGDYDRYRSRMYRYVAEDSPLSRIISSAERSYDLRLSWAAQQLLIIPIVEQLEDGESVSWIEVEKSVELLLQSMKEESRRDKASGGRAANSVDMIRAFFRRFCNIPPFCKATSERPR